jgi:hypothetical protein
MRETVVKKNN